MGRGGGGNGEGGRGKWGGRRGKWGREEGGKLELVLPEGCIAMEGRWERADRQRIL